MNRSATGRVARPPELPPRVHLKTRVDGMAMIALLFMQTGEEEGEWADAKGGEAFAKSVAPRH
ncbi:hypothetical protein MNQ95_03420 [Pseudoxanthomonas daejeonensis]|uniref:hypothetical protein n=1 Tax=Pseudoxanthomonas daejeonensis TaxID=266062 RepID=UPI001F5413F1|nr:hypothetical protein [Pseudoxanthomonas daejeonensis]UNK58171.1 hypothetical protein MNQ95_03420 [Pseudoxanthomonas daejeonensis]